MGRHNTATVCQRDVMDASNVSGDLCSLPLEGFFAPDAGLSFTAFDAPLIVAVYLRHSCDQ